MKNKVPLTTRLSSRNIDALIEEYRAGDMNSADKLLQCFRPLIGKYLKLFFYGSFDKEDKDIIKFLEACGKKDVSKTADIIRYRLRRYDAEELINIAQIALLETAKTYSNISASYKYVLHKHLKNMLWEDFPEGMPSIDLVTLEEESVREHNVEIDEDWVKGVTSGNGFSELSESQRLIVKMCYYDNIPDIHVAHSLQITINDLKRQKEYIKSILAKELNLKPGKDIRHERSC